MSACDDRWFAVQTKPNSEDRAAQHLRNQGYRVYLPKFSKQRRHARKIQRVARPLFAGYLFVGIDSACQGWRSINSTIGVARLISACEKPVSVPNSIINGLRERETEDGCVRLLPQRYLKNGDSVRVNEGAFENCFGLYEGMSDRERAMVLIGFLGRKVRVLVDPEALAMV